MIPNRKSKVPPRKSSNELQINRLFDNVEEIAPYLVSNFPNKKVSIVKTWRVEQVACVVKIED